MAISFDPHRIKQSRAELGKTHKSILLQKTFFARSSETPPPPPPRLETFQSKIDNQFKICTLADVDDAARKFFVSSIWIPKWIFDFIRTGVKDLSAGVKYMDSKVEFWFCSYRGGGGGGEGGKGEAKCVEVLCVEEGGQNV